MLDTVLERASGGPLIIAAVAVAIILLVALVVLASRYAGLVRELTAERQRAAGARGGPPAGSPGELMRASVDRVLMRNPVVFYLLVAVIAVATWLLGWAIAPSTSRFLASREWHIQPFYLAAHLVVLRLFVALFVRKYVAGAAQLDIPADQVAQGIRRILGPAGALVAAVIAAPLCALDFRYLVSERYDKLSEDGALHAIDYMMWGIWCAERVLAFYPQSIAAGILKEAMLRLFADRDSPSYIGDAYFGQTPLRAPIHDSLLLEIPDRAWDRTVEIVCMEMQRPVIEQPLPPSWGRSGECVAIGVAAKAGTDWAAMEEIQVPGYESDWHAEPVEDEDEDDWSDLGRVIAYRDAYATPQQKRGA